jgi:hypothetical protein
MNLDIDYLHRPLKLGRRSGRTTDLVFEVLGNLYYSKRNESYVVVVSNKSCITEFMNSLSKWNLMVDIVDPIFVSDTKIIVPGKGSLLLVTDHQYKNDHLIYWNSFVFFDNSSSYFSLNEDDYSEAEVDMAIDWMLNNRPFKN